MLNTSGRAPTSSLVATLAACALLAASPSPGAAKRAPAASPAPAQTSAGAISAERIHAHVAFLADDLLEGRGAGTRGYDLAAHYVEAQFRLLGLEPAGTQGYQQPIQFVEASPVLPAARFALERDGRRVELESMVDFLPALDFVEARSEVTAPLAFVGFGIAAPGYDDLAGADLQGRIAVVLSGAPASFPSNERAHWSSTFAKYPELIRRGAVGVITVRTPVDEKRVPWDVVVQQSWRPGMRWLDAEGRPANAWPELRRAATVGPSGAAKLFQGAPRTLEQVFADAEAGRPQNFPLPGIATLSGQTQSARRTSANVVGLLRGGDPALADEYVVVTAHLDGLGRGAAIGGDPIYNGAMDNATGVAMVLEMARALAAAPVRPRRSVLFLAVTAEERGLLGSDYYAEFPTVPRASIVANLNIDMPILLAPAADFVAYGAEHSTLGPVAERAARAEGFELSPDPLPEETVFVRSDQYSFVRRGIPAIYPDAGTRSSDPSIDFMARYEAFLRERYHRPSDDMDQEFHWPSFAALARISTRIVEEVASAAERPRWNDGDFFGTTFGTGRD